MTWRPSPTKDTPRYKDDGDLQVRFEQQLRENSYSSGALANAEAVINRNKFKGKKVWNEDTRQYLYARGPRKYDAWIDGEGMPIIYPSSAKLEGGLSQGTQTIGAGGSTRSTVRASNETQEGFGSGLVQRKQVILAQVDNRPSLWDDLRTPAVAINPPGAASDPDRDTADGTLLFSPTSTELIYGEDQLPHVWLESTEIRPHIHVRLTTTATGDVVLHYGYSIANGSSLGDAATSTNVFSALATAISTVSVSGVVDQHVIIPLANLDMTNYRVSCVNMWTLARIGGDAADTYPVDLKLVSYDTHYRRDLRLPGSVQEYIKDLSPGLIQLRQSFAGVISSV